MAFEFRSTTTTTRAGEWGVEGPVSVSSLAEVRARHETGEQASLADIDRARYEWQLPPICHRQHSEVKMLFSEAMERYRSDTPAECERCFDLGYIVSTRMAGAACFDGMCSNAACARIYVCPNCSRGSFPF